MNIFTSLFSSHKGDKVLIPRKNIFKTFQTSQKTVIMQQVCLLTVVSLFVTSAQCKTPGLQTRITDRALEYGAYT